MSEIYYTYSLADQTIQRLLTHLYDEVKEVIGRQYSLSLKDMITLLNPIIRGWNNYHTRIQADPKRF